MRFLSLDLLRYGHFTDRRIVFRPDAALHIIYGPNEAGKSSALSAFSDLLFGFPNRDVRYDFMHEAKELRIGAEIASPSGASLSFRRRKGNKNTLLTAEGEKALNEDALAPFIGNMSRTVFERAFGLDSKRLREGGDEMLTDGGEIGQMLFSAASGLTGLKAVTDRFAAEADGIYASRKSQNRSFYQALDRYDEARKAERTLELNASDWKTLLKEERDIEDELSALRADQYKRRGRMAELERLQNLRGLLAEVDRHDAALSAFADIDAVDDETASVLESLQARQSELSNALTAKKLRLQALDRDLQALPVNAVLLSRRPDIGQLQMETGLYQQALKALPQREEEFRQGEAALETIVADLVLESIADLEKLLPDAMLRARLSDLVDEGRALEREQASHRKALVESREALAALEDAGDHSHLIDPAPLRRQFDALRPDLARVAEIGALEAEIAEKRRAVTSAAGALLPAIDDIFAVRARDLPLSSSLREHREALDAAFGAVSDVERLIAETAAEMADLKARLEDEVRTGPVMTRAEIDRIRAHRDALWHRYTEAGGGADEYLSAVSGADEAADSALDDAERVSRHADYNQRLEITGRRHSELLQERAKAAKALETAKQAFVALFDAIGVTPRQPDEMAEWLREVQRLLDERDAVLSLGDRRNGLSGLADDLHSTLKRQAAAINAASDLPIAALARLVEAGLERLAERWEAAREREGALKASRQVIERRERDLAALAPREAAFDQSFAVCAKDFGLRAGCRLAEAETALQIWSRVPPLLAARERLAQAISENRNRISTFNDAVSALVSELAADLVGMPPVDAVNALADRAGEAVERSARREALADTKKELQQEFETEAATFKECTNAISDLAKGLPDGIAADGLVARLKERITLRRELADAHRRFDEVSDGAGETEIRTLAETMDSIACRQELEGLAADEAEAQAKLEALLESRSRCRLRKQALAQGESAETAAFAKNAAEEEARRLARDWVVLKLVGTLLDSALERYRQGRTDPVLEAAGAYFSRLTRGSFEALTQVYGSDDALNLVARRPDGSAVSLDGMSDGTRDQLYLALRLAFLDDYAARNEPPPFIVDDIFQTFDSARSTAGLNALAAVGRIQTILFTHEESLVRIAEKALGGEVDIIYLEN